MDTMEDQLRYSDVSDYDHHDEDDELRQAARAGILLLEKNQELQSENLALRAQVEVLESERPTLRRELELKEQELEMLREERKKSILEVNALRGELRAKSTMVTDLLDREQRLKQKVDDVTDSKRLAEYQYERLQAEYDEVVRKKAVEQPETLSKSDFAVSNPAASYDSNQTSVFTLSDYEELLHKWQTATHGNETMQLELKSLRKELDMMRRKASKALEYQQIAERLEKQTMKLQHANETMSEELTEERALIESLRTMNNTYKKIADSRPFSNTCSCSMHLDEQPQSPGITMQDDLVETNQRLEDELRELRVRLEAESATLPLDAVLGGNNGLLHDEVGTPSKIMGFFRRLSGASSLSLTSDTPTSSDGFSDSDVLHDKLIKKVQDLQEKLSVAKDMIRHTKQQWHTAIASQKALEECNERAQEEITRLTQLVDYQMSSMAGRRKPSMHDGAVDNNDADAKSTDERDRSMESEEDEDKWVEETAPYPAPPGDLNSPLIKCLLDHWTTDKSKVMHLTDWLHHAIRGTGKPMPLRLDQLSSEVAAGFTQLLVPILRERHGVSVTVYRRDSVQILSDMVLQAHQPNQPTSIFSSVFGSSSQQQVPTPPSSTGKIKLSRSSSGGSSVPSEFVGSSGPSSARRRRESPFLMSETHFLLG